MNRAAAWAIVLLLLTASLAAYALPLLPVAAATALALALARRHRTGLLVAVATTLLLQTLIFGCLTGDPAWRWGIVTWSPDGARLGLAGGTRLAAVLAINLAALTWISMQRLLDGLHLPAGATAFLSAVALNAQDLGRDAQHLVAAARLDGRWPRNRLARAATAARLLPALLVSSVRRATIRAEALRLAGHDTGPRFAALVAVTALAAAGRLAFVAIPNVALTYVVVFAGGLLFGPRIAAAAGALAMALTNLLLTGLAIAAFANVPAMALVGLLGGALRSHASSDLTRATAGALGFGVTLAFSVLADVSTWLLVAEFRGDAEALRALVTAGLVFNAVPAVVNAILFAVAIAPLTHAGRALGWMAPGQGLGRQDAAVPRETRVG